MIKLFKPLISLWRLYRKVKSIDIAYRLLPTCFTPVINTSVKKSGKDVVLTEYNKTYSQKQLKLFGNHGELLLKYIKSHGITFFPCNLQDEIVSVKINNKEIFLHAFNYDSLKVIEEVFIDHVYSFDSTGEYVVCDAGMNIAAASLYFASFDNIEKVYGYEPFPDTFALARKNIALNTEINHKIETFEHGLGASDHFTEVPLPEDGFLGGTTTPFFIDELPGSLKTKRIRVDLKSIAVVIPYIQHRHPGKKIILKLDCEGAEYEIMEELERKNMLDSIAVYMIEYHFKGKKQLTKMFLQRNFGVLSPCNDDISPFGMLYAFKL